MASVGSASKWFLLIKRGSVVVMVIAVLLGLGVDVKLEDASNDQSHYGTSTEPPCHGYACCKAGYDKEDKS